MKIIINYVVQGEKNHWYNSEMLDLSLIPPLYSPQPHQKDVESEIMKWAKEKQSSLNEGEQVIVLKTLYT